MLAFAEKFFGHVSSSDIEGVADCYHDDVTVWHNYDDVDQTKQENLATLGSIPQRYDRFGYSQPRHTVLEDGFLRQHVIEVERNGRSASIPAILRVYVDGGKIRRIEEYFDRSKLEALFAS